MSTKSNTENPFINISQFYVKLAEQAAPVLKQSMEDWIAIYSKLWTEGLKLQNEWFNQMSDVSNFSQFTERSKKFAEAAMETQKKASSEIVDAAVKSVKSFKKPAKKAPARAKK